MTESFMRIYNQLFNSGASLHKIRDAVLADHLLEYAANSVEVAGRSLVWKLFLIQSEPLKSSLDNVKPDPILSALRSLRKRYADVLSDKMRAPDGSYAEGFVIPGSVSSPRREGFTTENLDKNNPLSLHNDNPWTEWFASQELRKTISQDVERTFPEIDFFRNVDVQDQLTNILYLYSITNPDVGYRQGMHELLAPLYYAVDVDSIDDSDIESVDSKAAEMCSKIWVAADAWVLFCSVMRFVSRWYEWRESPPLSQTSGSPLSNHVHLNIPPDGQTTLRPYIAPIVEICNNIQSTLLRTTDPLLWRHLQSSGIEPQIYGIRWLRLLFTREFIMSDAMRLWDGLLACDPTFELVPWVCVAMLIRIRNNLIPSDYTGQLTALLRYPTPPNAVSSSPHHTTLLLRQAIALQMSPTPATGVSLMMENRNTLNIPAETPDPPPAPRKRDTKPIRDKTASRSGGHTRQQSAQQAGFPEMFARGLLERGESLGINKTLMSAVTELRRNIPELAASLVRAPTHNPSAFPLMDERMSEERPPWEPRTRLDMEREITQLHSANKRLGDSLTWVVDVFLQDETEAKDPQKLVKQRREALESLAYVRDVLTAGITELEDERLFSEEENAKRKLHAQQRAEAKASNVSSDHFATLPKPKAPAPAPVVDSRPKSTGSLLRNVSPVIPQLPSTFSPSLTPDLSKDSNSARMAPWNYTKSNFSGDGSSLPSTSLPRLPPPSSSSSIRRPPTTSFGSSRGGGENETNKGPSKPRLTPDPLGVLK